MKNPPATAAPGGNPRRAPGPGRLLRSRGAGLLLLLSACSSSSSPPPPRGETGAILLRTFQVALTRDVKLGKAHPPLHQLIYSGGIPGGQSAKDQHNALWRRFTIPDLKLQHSDAAPVELGGSAQLSIGFGDEAGVEVSHLARAEGEALTAEFAFRFRTREPLRRRIPFRNGDALLFAGHLDASLPLLSVFSLEIRFFGPGEERERQDFLAQAGRDRSP